MKPPIVYLDTSFFIGYLENQAGRRADCKDVLQYERDEGSTLYTSLLTVNEFLVKTYSEYRDHPDCDEKVERVISSIRDIANTYALNDEVMKESARLMSVRGYLYKIADPPLPRDRKFRWDSLHMATAQILKADRVYCFDDPWTSFPKNELSRIGQIICPALRPQPTLRPITPS